MASALITVSLSSSSTLIDGKAPRQQAATSPHKVAIPSFSPPPLAPQSHPQGRDTRKATAYCSKIGRNVMARAAGESSIMATGEPAVEISATELPEILKTIQEAAIDRLPLVPGALEVVGIGYTGWFAYKNLVFKPDREALIKKIKDTYNDIIGSS